MNKLKAILCAVALLILLKNNVFKISDLPTIAGLAFAAWQVYLAISASRETEMNNLHSSINCDIDKIKQDSDKKDFYHEQEINRLAIAISDLNHKLEHHANQAGHQMMVEQVLQIKDALSDLRAITAVLTRQGEIAIKLEKMQLEINKIKDKL